MLTVNLKGVAGLNLAVVKKSFVRLVTEMKMAAPDGLFFDTYLYKYVSVNISSVDNTIEATRNLKSWRKIPGPPSLPMFGTLLNFLHGGPLHGYKGVHLSKRIHELYGPIARIDGVLGTRPAVWVFEADAIEYILRNENTMPIRPGFDSLDYYRKRHNKVYDHNRPTGLISDHGEVWKEFRDKVNHILLQPKTIKLYSDVLEDVANDMIKRMKSIRDENNVMIQEKFDNEISLWALESIGVVALGTRLNCFDPNLTEDSPARKLIKNIRDFFDIAEKLDFRPSFWQVYSTSTFKKAMKIYENHENLTRFYIKKYEDSKKSRIITSNTEKPILDQLLDIDVNVALIMASDMLLAGVDTTANTVAATLYLLAKNPEKQDELRKEILLTERNQRPYLRACIKESMRIMPVVNGNARKTTKEHELMGYKIPKDVLIIFPHKYMSVMERHYPKPNEFIPERWLVEKGDPLYHGKANAFVTSPFGFGVRMCIGRRIAQLELETVISKVVENFEIEWDGPPPDFEPAALNYLTGPLNYIFNDI